MLIRPCNTLERKALALWVFHQVDKPSPSRARFGFLFSLELPLSTPIPLSQRKCPFYPDKRSCQKSVTSQGRTAPKGQNEHLMSCVPIFQVLLHPQPLEESGSLRTTKGLQRKVPNLQGVARLHDYKSRNETTHIQDNVGFRHERKQPHFQGPFHS